MMNGVLHEFFMEKKLFILFLGKELVSSIDSTTILDMPTELLRTKLNKIHVVHYNGFIQRCKIMWVKSWICIK